MKMSVDTEANYEELYNFTLFVKLNIIVIQRSDQFFNLYIFAVNEMRSSSSSSPLAS